MRGEHADVQELLAAAALGAATPAEEALVEAHVRTCVVCSEDLLRLRATAGALAAAHEDPPPPRALRARVMSAARADARRADVLRRATDRPTRRLAPARWPVLAGTLAAVLAALLVLSLVGAPWTSSPRELVVVDVRGSAQAPAVQGELLYLPDHEVALLRLRNLPDPGPGDAYALWKLRDAASQPVFAGFLDAREGERVAAAADLAGVTALALTREARTNRSVPTSPPLLVTELPDAAAG